MTVSADVISSGDGTSTRRAASESRTHEGLPEKASKTEQGARGWARGRPPLPPFIPTRGPCLSGGHSLPPSPSLGRHPIGGHLSPVTSHQSHLSGSRQIGPIQLPSHGPVRGAGETRRSNVWDGERVQCKVAARALRPAVPRPGLPWPGSPQQAGRCGPCAGPARSPTTEARGPVRPEPRRGELPGAAAGGNPNTSSPVPAPVPADPPL